MSGAARVYTIPAGVSFLDALALGLCAETAGDPFALSQVTVLLPTRRACRALRDCFLRQTEGKPTLLPHLRPVGDVDDDELALGDEGGLDLPPAIAPLRRRLMLARTILSLDADPDRGRSGERTAPQAIELATELATLLDQVQTERAGFDGLDRLVPDDLADHWRRTVEFLRILSAHWPAILAAEGAIDPAARRDRALTALCDLWRRHPPSGRIIAAGSTGSIPATADLLYVVSRLPRGAVLLPGLDRDLDEASWQALDECHPQYGLRELLKALDVTPDAVADWPHGGSPPPVTARRQLLSAAMRPAATTALWHQASSIVPRDAIEGLAYVETAHAQEEAQSIALVLREALETPGRTAALITPDRDLARRVAAELGRFGIGIDDSAGRPLAATPPVAFLRLIAEAIAEGAAPAPLLALLKHPLAGGGLPTAEFRARARALEIEVLRGPRPSPGLDSIVAALHAEKQPHLAAWAEQLADQARAFARLAAADAAPADLLHAHVALAERWAATDAETGAARLWAGQAGEAAADFVAELSDAVRDFPPLHGSAYPAFFERCLQGRVVRPSWGGHPRLHILGPLEARLLSFDLVVLGGLNEGTWPLDPTADPWMSRPMRKAFGLAAPERRIGLAAHDFVQACAAPKVILTRAVRVEGTPTVPSRWLQRLDAVMRAAQLASLDRRPELERWREALDAAEPLPAAGPPAPCPPVRARPRQLAVTQIETWLRDPYAIYARHVLRLKKLDPLDADPGAAERGQIVHEALHAFVDKFPAALPGDAVARLLEIGRGKFGTALQRPGVWAFWWPRFEAIARWFVAHEVERRRDATPLTAEGSGTLVLFGPAGEFTLTARVDRIDRLADGTLAIIDYKTGSVPNPREVVDGLAPQLPLEAVIARAGRFAGVDAAPVTQLRYWRLSGGDPAGEEIPLDGATYGRNHTPVPAPVALADAALAGLTALIARFDDPATRYLARPRPDHALRHNDYAHLARVQEWSAEEGA